ncbi:MAG: DUF1850 domain-containing protein [Bacillota bacterium]
MKKIYKYRYILILLIFIIISFYFIKIPVLTLKHFQKDKILYSVYINEKDEFLVKWIHSVELTPWEEIFRIGKNKEIILDRTRFKQFGAGVPDKANGKIIYKNGYIIYDNINRKISLIPYAISKLAKHTFIIKNKTIRLYKLVPDGDRINIYIEKINIFKYINRKINL